METVDAVGAPGNAGPSPVHLPPEPCPSDRTTPDVPDEIRKEPEVSESTDDAAPDPRDLRREPGKEHARENGREEPDPTGVRAILAALPDPGPMPSDLVRRITASLAAEGALAHHIHSLDGDRAGALAVHSLADARERRRPGRLPVIAIAASVVVLAGVVIMGLLATTVGLGVGAGSDTAAQHSTGDGAEDDRAGAAEEADPLASAEMAPDSDSGAEALLAGGTPLLASGAVLTGATLADHARTVRDDPAALGHDPAADLARTAGAAGTLDGAADCLSGLLSIDPAAALSLVRAVDVVRFDGSLVALILAGDVTGDLAPDASALPTDAEPADPAPATTAYLVPLDCARRDAVTLHDPVSLDS